MSLSHYEVLRINPEKDINGKEEAEIIKKVEANYALVIIRIEKVYKDESQRMQAVKQANEARIILTDQQKRQSYDYELSEKRHQVISDSVELEFIYEPEDEYEQDEDIEDENSNG